MIKKSLIAAAAVAISVAGLSATSAQAGKWHGSVNIGLYGPGFYGYPAYDDYGYGHGGSWGVSCGEAKWQVKSANFKKVNTVNCGGKVYTFTGWKHGDKYRIKVGRKHGQIISVSALY